MGEHLPGGYAEFMKVPQRNILPIPDDFEFVDIVAAPLAFLTAWRALITRGRVQPGAVLVNCCRGGIVDEDALLERLDSGALMAACFDVFAIEPAQNDRLLRHPNMLAAPHIGASTEETRLIMVRAAIKGLTNAKVVEPEDFYGV